MSRDKIRRDMTARENGKKAFVKNRFTSDKQERKQKNRCFTRLSSMENILLI